MSSRGNFSSRLGFILAAAGSAVGLGNIWKFPFEVADGGGAAFVVIYLAFAGTLLSYSTRRAAYVRDLRSVIRSNRLTDFDSARLAPDAAT